MGEGVLRDYALVKVAVFNRKGICVMERNRSGNLSEGNSLLRARDVRGQDVLEGALAWWYRHLAPPEPPANANFAQRERVRRGRTASIVVPIFMLFLLGMLLLAFMERNYTQAIAIGLGMAGSVLALWLNRQGWIKVAGLLVLVIGYAGEIFSLGVEPGGLTASNMCLLDFTVISDVVVLAFFSANSLFPVIWLNVLLIWGLLTFGPHDATIADMLYHEPLQIFARVYILQLVMASTLYLWARSTEVALQRADRAEEIAALEKRENERSQVELEQKAQLDTGIQQVLQTLVAAANGDLSARTPLNQDHILWQVAMSLNNLIARLQSSSYAESELRQQIWEGNERVTDHHYPVRPEMGRATGAQNAFSLETKKATGAQRALPLEIGAERALGTQRSKSRETGQQPRSRRAVNLRPEARTTGSHLKALRLEQEGAIDQEKVTRPDRGEW